MYVLFYIPVFRVDFRNIYSSVLCGRLCRCDYLSMPFWKIYINQTARLLIPPPPGAAYMRQWTGTALVQVMACRLFGVKPLPEPMLVYCQLDSWEQTWVRCESKYKTFHSWKCISKWRPFVQEEMFWYCCFNPRNLPRAITISVIIVMLLYMAVNVAYIAVLGVDDIRNSPAVAMVNTPTLKPSRLLMWTFTLAHFTRRKAQYEKRIAILFRKCAYQNSIIHLGTQKHIHS